jgi:hypothetical protein
MSRTDYERREDLARLHDIPTTDPWHCPRHRACTCPPPLPAEHCPTHGPYTPTSALDADCPKCEDRAARLDAEHTHRYSTDYRYR